MEDSITGVSNVELNTTEWESENISPHLKFNALNEVFSIHTIVSLMEDQNIPSKSSVPLTASTPKPNKLKDTVIQTSKDSNGIQCKKVISVL